MEDKKKKFQYTLAKVIKNRRENLKLSMTKASDVIGLTKSVWSVVEAGERDPQLFTLWRMAESLNIPLSEIIKEVEKELGD